MHEEACHDGSEDFAPFDKDTIPVCVLTENSSYYIEDFKNMFDRHRTLLGNFWDYTNENLTADQVEMAKKINMGKNQVNAIMTYISFNRLCLTNLMSPHALDPSMTVYLVQLLAMIIDVLLRRNAGVCSTIPSRYLRINFFVSGMTKNVLVFTRITPLPF
jgi:hypothetical protein